MCVEFSLFVWSPPTRDFCFLFVGGRGGRGSTRTNFVFVFVCVCMYGDLVFSSPQPVRVLDIYCERCAAL